MMNVIIRLGLNLKSGRRSKELPFKLQPCAVLDIFWRACGVVCMASDAFVSMFSLEAAIPLHFEMFDVFSVVDSVRFNRGSKRQRI